MITNKQALALQDQIIQKAYKVLMPKRRDYSGTNDPFRNFRMSLLFGIEPWRGCAIRLTDKLSRIRSIVEAGGIGHVHNETLLDTFADIINYTCILAGLVAEMGHMELPNDGDNLEGTDAATETVPDGEQELGPSVWIPQPEDEGVESGMSEQELDRTLRR